MPTRKLTLLTALAAAIALGFTAAPLDQVSGIVRDQSDLSPIGGAVVRLQATAISTTTLPDGSYSIDVPSGTELVIAAARKGYFNGAVTVDSPAINADIFLDLVPQTDDPAYMIQAPNGCSVCHYPKILEMEETPMARAGLNSWVNDIYSGTGTPTGMGGFVYTRDSVHKVSNPDSECAACHQPQRWIENGYAGALDDDVIDPAENIMHGISCDICHKIADVDVAKINFPGIYPGAVTFTRPAGPGFDQVQYGVLGDTDYVNEPVMRASYNPQLVAETCAVCHQDANDPDGNGDFSEPNSIISEPTYLEWLASPYGDENDPLYASCVDCHMPPSGDDTVCSILFPPLFRDPATIRSHTILGTTPEYLENAVELDMTVAQNGMGVDVDVDITNSLTGHHVPTGVTIRNMILLVEAWADGDDPLTDPLVHLGTQVVHDLGGVGDPAQGYYAGLPGRYFSKVNHDATGAGPTFFTDATGIQFDNRIPALATDSSSYSFLVPAVGDTVHVRARLIYRRSFRFLTDAKQWTEDGHGNPLADVLPPDYGHLMESAQTSVAVSGHWSNVGYAKAGTNGEPVLQGTGPFTPDSINILSLSSALESASTMLVASPTPLYAAFKGSVLVPGPDVILPLTTDAAGDLSLQFRWPIGLPAGIDLYYQMWVLDPGATQGFAASNGLQSTSQ
jgi:hypothetical protein